MDELRNLIISYNNLYIGFTLALEQLKTKPLSRTASIERNADISQTIHKMQDDIKTLNSITSANVNKKFSQILVNHKTESKIKLKGLDDQAPTLFNDKKVKSKIDSVKKKVSQERLFDGSKTFSDEHDSKHLLSSDVLLRQYKQENVGLKKIIFNYSGTLKKTLEIMKGQQMYPNKSIQELEEKIEKNESADDWLVEKEINEEYIPKLLKEQKAVISMKILNLNLQNFKKSDKMKIVDTLDEIKEIPNLFIWFVDFMKVKVKKLLKRIESIKSEKRKIIYFLLKILSFLYICKNKILK